MPSDHRPVFAAYFLASVVVFAYTLAESIGIVIAVLRWRRLICIFEGGLTESLLHRMDAFEDGKVRFVSLQAGSNEFQKQHCVETQPYMLVDYNVMLQTTY